MKVQEAMSPNPRCATAQTSIREVLQTLGEADIRHLPIVEGQKLVGIVSTHDLRAFVPAPGAYRHPHEVQQMLDQPVGEVMNQEVICVHPDTDLSEAIDALIEHKIGALPVVASAERELVGILSYVDVLRIARPLV